MRALLAVAVSVLCLVACGSSGGAPTGSPTTAAAPTTNPPEPVPTSGQDAWVDVAVANLWAEPDQARPLDAPSTTNPVDLDGWLAAMTVDDKLWLVGRLVTQALYGDRVTVVGSSGGWSEVVLLRQPTTLDPRGYPGWLPTAQLSAVPPERFGDADAVVIRPAADLRDGLTAVLRLSYNTRLPVLVADATWVTVGTPGGGRARLATADVAVIGPETQPPTGDQIVKAARQFAGVPYLWGGTSAPAWDCSGLTSTVYAAHGVVIPRDADDQAAVGTPVERADLRPGDLLFYATGPGRDSIHHVGIYVGDGTMIQAPATGRTVETVPIDKPGLASEYWGARRYLPSE